MVKKIIANLSECTCEVIAGLRLLLAHKICVRTDQLRYDHCSLRNMRAYNTDLASEFYALSILHRPGLQDWLIQPGPMHVIAKIRQHFAPQDQP